jgi:hypothetical protein
MCGAPTETTRPGHGGPSGAPGGRTGHPDEDPEEIIAEAGNGISAKKAQELVEFMVKPRKNKAAQTAKEKRLAAKRKKVAKELDLFEQWGKLLDGNEPIARIRQGRETLRVAPREFLMWKVLRIRNKQGRRVSLKVNAAQREFARTAKKKNIVLKARQLGITTYVAARFFLNCMTRPGTVCVQVAHDQRSAEEIFKIVHRMLASLPDWMREGALATSHANKRQIAFPHMDSSYMVEAANENAGRGLTIQYLHCSEVSRWPGDAAATLAALRAAVPPDGEIVLESTANGACGCFYDEWLHAEEKGYSRHFFPWWWEPSYKRKVEIAELSEEELELMDKYGLTAEQIGFRREVRANFGGRAAEEFAEDAESCFRASGECYFDLGVVEQRMHSLEPAIEQTDNGRLMVFLPEKAGKEYIIGVDPAGGGSEGDYACAQVIDRASGLQCAELRGHLDRYELAGRVASLARRYNMAEVVVERNNHGHDVLSHLSFYHRDVPVYEEKGHAGWLTNVATRPRMLGNLEAVLKSAPCLFMSARLLEECKTFVRRPDGSPAAANGAHDDTVMAMAIAQIVRTEGAVKRRAPEVGVLEGVVSG